MSDELWVVSDEQWEVGTLRAASEENIRVIIPRISQNFALSLWRGLREWKPRTLHADVPTFPLLMLIIIPSCWTCLTLFNLLTLGIVQASMSLLSLNRKFQHDIWIHLLFIPPFLGSQFNTYVWFSLFVVWSNAEKISFYFRLFVKFYWNHVFWWLARWIFPSRGKSYAMARA